MAVFSRLIAVALWPGLFLSALAVFEAGNELRARLHAPGKRFGAPEEYASLALEMCRNSYFNGEDVRLDGAIRMAPR